MNRQRNSIFWLLLLAACLFLSKLFVKLLTFDSRKKNLSNYQLRDELPAFRVAALCFRRQNRTIRMHDFSLKVTWMANVTSLRYIATKPNVLAIDFSWNTKAKLHLACSTYMINGCVFLCFRCGFRIGEQNGVDRRRWKPRDSASANTIIQPIWGNVSMIVYDLL